VAHPETAIRLDTAAWHAARAARLTRGALYWLILVAGVTAAGIGIALAGARLEQTVNAGRVAPHHHHSRPRTVTLPGAPSPAVLAVRSAPAPWRTPVEIWNASGISGWASHTASRLAHAGFRIVGAGNAPSLPRGGIRGLWVFYAPGAQAAAVALARRLGADPRRVVRPLDGIRPQAIRPALLVVLRGAA
jgi:LytR cell envelope-related transcriptional attenuator